MFIDFTTMDIATLTQGISGEGVRYLELFLREYTTLFPGVVNPSCPRCLNAYLTRYKKHFKEMSNECQYRLHPKYENIPLEFGSAILVNNENITDEYALKLLNQPNGQRFFYKTPEGEIETSLEHGPPGDGFFGGEIEEDDELLQDFLKLQALENPAD